MKLAISRAGDVLVLVLFVLFALPAALVAVALGRMRREDVAQFMADVTQPKRF